MQDNTESRSNPKDRNFDQEDVGGESRSTNGHKQQEDKEQDDYDAQNRDFDNVDSPGQPNIASKRKPDEKEEEKTSPSRHVDPSLRQGHDDEAHKGDEVPK